MESRFSKIVQILSLVGIFAALAAVLYMVFGKKDKVDEDIKRLTDETARSNDLQELHLQALKELADKQPKANKVHELTPQRTEQQPATAQRTIKPAAKKRERRSTKTKSNAAVVANTVNELPTS